MLMMLGKLTVLECLGMHFRRTYVVAFRTEDTVAQERAAGFTHSHNDDVNWDTFNRWQEQ